MCVWSAHRRSLHPHSENCSFCMFSLFNLSFIFPGGQLTPFAPMCGRPCGRAQSGCIYGFAGFVVRQRNGPCACGCRLSGLSPFMGDDDAETLANVIRGRFSFEFPEFDGVSDDAKDIIRNLLVADKRSDHATDFTARRYASAVYAMIPCLSVCVCLCLSQVSVLRSNGDIADDLK